MLTRSLRSSIQKPHNAPGRLKTPAVVTRRPWREPSVIRHSSSYYTLSQRRPSLAIKSASAESLSAISRTHLDVRPLATATDSSLYSSDLLYPTNPLDLPPGASSDGSIGSFPLDKPNPFEISFHYVNHELKYGRAESPVLFQTLHAALQSGSFERAESVLRYLAKFYHSTSPELIEAHNLYIRAHVDALVRNPDSEVVARLQYWFEREMRDSQIPPNETTLALMCRASIIALTGERQVRSLRRYLEIAAEKTRILAQLLDSGEFTHSEWRTLNRLIESHGDLPMQEFDPVHVEEASFRMEPVEKPHEIQSVEQKSQGLSTLRKTLASLQDMNDEGIFREVKGDMSAYYQWKFDLQERLEQDAIEAGVEEWRSAHENMIKMGITPGLETKPMKAVMWRWYSALLPLVKKEVANAKRRGERHNGLGTVSPFFPVLPPEKLAAITIVTTLRTLMTTGPKGSNIATTVAVVARNIGVALQGEATALHNGPGKQGRSGARKPAKTAGTRKFAAPSDDRAGIDVVPIDEAKFLTSMQAEWPVTVRIQIGGTLLGRLLEVATVHVRHENPKTGQTELKEEPALTHQIAFKRGRRVGMVAAHEALRDLLVREPPGGLLGVRLPMLVQPKPWEGLDEGAFLTLPSRLVRENMVDAPQRMYLMAACERGDLDQMFQALNILGRTPWKINDDVFKVMVDAWNTEEAFADIPPAHPHIPYPPEPSAEEGPVARAKWLRRRREIDNEISGYHSNRCFQNLQLEVARAFRGNTMYFPHNIDFRGRAYPLPPFLNHMGADNARGLLQFGVAKELGEHGLFWLKVQIANLHGFDKASLSERAEYTTSHIDDIRDSAAKPLEGKRWWLKAEDPWQCLAACFDYVRAIDSPDPTKYKSSLPVHQDGTCNGLQHYAALGGDSFGATQVNLMPGDRPADVYSGVAELVKAAIKKDAAAGDASALAVDGKITRKVVKQTVMTNVYGVTFVGAREQVNRQLDAIIPDQGETSIPNYTLAAYVAHKIFDALSTMFQGAHGIQDWLGQCAIRISTTLTPEQIERIAQLRPDGESTRTSRASKNPSDEKVMPLWEKPRYAMSQWVKDQFQSSVVWTTPLKLPVVQPYRAHSTRQIASSMQRITIKEPVRNHTVSKRKQLQGFPPNFVHSLDATHMMLTALKCDELDLTFAAVHDSFWTHAADVPVMNRVLREAFVTMHSEDIIGRLAEELTARHRGALRLLSVPRFSKIGKAITKYRKDRYTKQEDKTYRLAEIIEEKERQDLLRSEDEAERAEGRAMVTAASIYEAMVEADPGAAVCEAIQEVLEEEPIEEDIEEGEDLLAQTLSDTPADVAEVEEVVPESKEAAAQDGASAKKAPPKKKQSVVEIWVPLVIPPVPKRGDFDVRLVKDSPYFFS